VLTRSIVAGYLCFLPFVPSFLVTLVSSPLLIHPPPRAHTRRATASRSPPSLFPGAVGQKKRKKKEKKRKKESSQKKGKKIPKKERLPHSPSGKREPIRLGEGVLRHSFPWLRSFLGCTMHALVAISPPHRAIPSLSSTISRIPLSFWKKCVWYFVVGDPQCLYYQF
jgi:hypothetical protein